MLVREFTITFAFFYGVLLVFSGVIIPLEAFPEIVQDLARVLPLTNGLDAVPSAVRRHANRRRLGPGW